LPKLCQRAAAAVMACLAGTCMADDHWSGSLRSKVQIDNRYRMDRDASLSGEAWGQVLYENPDLDMRAVFDGMERLVDNMPNNRTAGKLYQGYVQKGFESLASKVKLGRFQRTDNLGFYYLDGADIRVEPAGQPFRFDVYGGRPGRIDHTLSVSGEYLFGAEGFGHFEPHWRATRLPASVDTLDIRLGYQHFKNFVAVDRITGGLTTAGQLGDSGVHKYEANFSGTYRADLNRLENVWMTGQLDLTKQVRLRTSYEEYRPRSPFPTFRERFYTALALGEQTLLKASFHVRPDEDYNYYAGGQRATRGRGVDGYGAYTGLQITHWPGWNLAGEVDYLELGKEHAESFYLSAAHSPSAKWRVQANAALRFEDRLLYGQNRAIGGEVELQYMYRNDLIFSAAGSHIWNTQIENEYLGAVQLIYYFDNFKPKSM
jgi:hypothetical protein